MSSIADLRKAAKHSESLVARKIRRMASAQDGYDVTGTNLDPRKPKGWVDRATRKQLEKYMADLKYFRRPSIGWVKSASGSPIRRQVIRNAESAARTRNRRVREIDRKLQDIPVAWHHGKTYGELRAERNTRDAARKRRINDEQGVRTTTRVKRRSINYSSEKAAIRSAKMNREMDDEVRTKMKIKRTRKETMQMLEGENRLSTELQALTDAQFWFAWTATPRFANAMKLVYQAQVGMLDSASVYKNEVGEIELIVKEAGKLNLETSMFWA